MLKDHRPPPPDPAEMRHEIEEQLGTARTYRGVGPADGIEIPIALRGDERMLFSVSGAMLVETRRGRGHWQGGSQGISVRVPGTTSMRYRIGATRGTLVPGEETPTVIDVGTFTVTGLRATFMGAKQTREWAWAKLIGVAHQPDAPWTALAVSNRQRTSGVGYDEAHAGLIRFWIDLAVAHGTGTLDTFIGHLESELAAITPAGPAGTAEPSGPSTPLLPPPSLPPPPPPAVS
jgi:hypothetical protein